MAQSVEREGIWVGLIAAVCVAVFYAGFDQLAARGPLYTVNLLGLTLFRGARDPAILELPVPVDLPAIMAYTGLHLVLSLTIGVIVTRLIGQAERQPSRAPFLLAVIVAGFIATILAIGYLSTPMRAVLPWWSIVVANSLAVVVVAAYLLRRHPRLGGLMLGTGSAAPAR